MLGKFLADRIFKQVSEDMIDEKKTAIITYIDNYFIENLEFDFLKSLYEKASYKGKVIIMNYGMAVADKERILNKYNVIIIDYKKVMPVFSNRYFDIPKLINELDSDIKHIMLVDCGDVWFQTSLTPLFKECEDKIGSVEEKRPIGNDEFTKYCLDNLDDKERIRIGQGLVGKNIINSGMICGPRELVRSIISRVSEGMRINNTCYFGVDQVYYDSEWYALADNLKVYLDEKYNYVLISNTGRYSIKDDIIYDENEKIVTVVHNAGANWRVLKRPFTNKNINEQQYFDIQLNKKF